MFDVECSMLDVHGGWPAPATVTAVAANADRGSPASAGRTNVERQISNVSLGQASSIKFQVSSFSYFSPSDPDGAGLPLLKSETNSRGTLTYAWWPNGARKSLHVASPAGELYTATYAFDLHARLTELTAAFPGQPATRFFYEYVPQTDLIAAMRSSHGVGQTYDYDRLQRRRATSFHLTPGSDYWREAFAYNAAGFRVHRTNDFCGARATLVDAFTYDELGQLTSATRRKSAQPRKDYFFAWRYDTVGNRVNEQRAAFSFGFWYNNLNQMTMREWQGGLTVSGKTQPGAANVAVNGKTAQVDADGEYVVEAVDVTTPLLANQGIGDDRTRDLVTGVNTNVSTKSVRWEKVRLAPQQIELRYDAAGNMTTDGRIAYTWDAENRLIRCEDVDLHASTKRRSEYVYDSQMRRIEKRDYEQDETGWKLLVTTKYLYDGWDIVAAYVTTGSATTTHAYVYGADVSGTLGGAGGIGGLLAELQFGGEGTTKAPRHQGSYELRFTNYDLRGGETVAAIGDRGNVAWASRPLEVADSTRNWDGSATGAAIGDRGLAAENLSQRRGGAENMATAMPTRGNHGSAVAAAAEEEASAPVTRSGAALAVARRATDMQSRPAGTSVPTMSGLATLHLFVFDSMGNTRHKVAVSSGGATVIATYEYDPYGRLLYAEPPPAQETGPQFLFSTKLYESHWQHYYYGYRYYSPDLGRWLSRDPIGEEDGPNEYGFVRNRPVFHYDPIGLAIRTLPVFGAGNGRALITWDEYECEPTIKWIRKPHFGTGAAHEFASQIFGGIIGVRIKRIDPILTLATGDRQRSSYSRTHYYRAVYSTAGYTATFEFRPVALVLNIVAFKAGGAAFFAKKASAAMGVRIVATAAIVGAASALDDQLKQIGAKTWTYTETIDGRGYIKCTCKKE